jgi:alpha-1,3-rhamnosyl/mannosyltransferase
MRIIYNGTSLLGPLTGIGQYAYQLALRIERMPETELHVFYGHEVSREVRPRERVVPTTMRQAARTYVPFAYDIAFWLRQRRFTRAVRPLHCDVYHEPNFLAYGFDGPLVLTVHDLSWIRYPETHPPERVRAMHRYFEPSLRRANIVLTVSEFVKREVVEVFGLDASRIRAIPNGLDPLFRPMAAPQTASFLAPHGLAHGEYLLSVGTLEPRKNLERTVHAYAMLPAALRARFPLVIVGAKGWHTQGIQSVLQPLVASGEARVLGYVERDELVALTAGAAAMAYPSLYEGFGLPPLEAMGCGVAPIASSVSSLPEVVGDAGLLVDPLDVDAISRAMRTLLEDVALRHALSQRALERSRDFTWDACAQRTCAAYRDASSAYRSR